MEKDSTKRICLWSGPRNISTALMYAFAQRSDTKVYDEPLYAHYLKHSNASAYHPGAADILRTMENDGNKVIEMMMGAHDKPVVFFKQMTHHLLHLNRGFMKHVQNIILTRDPVEMLPSFGKVIKTPTIDDVGYAMHVALVKFLNALDTPPVVLDAKKVLLNPQKVLAELCDCVGIDFESTMLQWGAGARPEDGIWAKYWYESLHKSTGFEPYQPKTTAFPKRLEPLLAQCLPYYQQLKALALGD